MFDLQLQQGASNICTRRAQDMILEAIKIQLQNVAGRMID